MVAQRMRLGFTHRGFQAKQQTIDGSLILPRQGPACSYWRTAAAPNRPNGAPIRHRRPEHDAELAQSDRDDVRVLIDDTDVFRRPAECPPRPRSAYWRRVPSAFSPVCRGVDWV